MNMPPELVGSPDRDVDSMTQDQDGEAGGRWLITFDGALADTKLTNVMHRMLKTLEKVYDYPVDIEFTLNFTTESSYAVNLVQCRPLQTKGVGKRVSMPEGITQENIFFHAEGTFMGSNTMQPIRRIIFVDPEGYSALSLSQKYDIARLIGKINRGIIDRQSMPTLLIGPGRWGTTTPSLGVPVRFSEINNVCLIVELAHMREGLMPELSFGTHFFLDLVETDIFYIALFPDTHQSSFNMNMLRQGPNILKEILPEQEKYEHVVIIQDLKEGCYYLFADVVSQKVVCFRWDGTRL